MGVDSGREHGREHFPYQRLCLSGSRWGAMSKSVWHEAVGRTAEGLITGSCHDGTNFELSVLVPSAQTAR